MDGPGERQMFDAKDFGAGRPIRSKVTRTNFTTDHQVRDFPRGCRGAVKRLDDLPVS